MTLEVKHYPKHSLQVNDLQARIKDTTRKMMAMVSELSMNQANALKLQQNLKEKEGDLEQCYIRMEKGEPPSDEIEQEWLRVLRDDDRRMKDKEEIRMVCKSSDLVHKDNFCHFSCLRFWPLHLSVHLFFFIYNLGHPILTVRDKN